VSFKVHPSGEEPLLEEQEWFHGVLPRDEVQRLLNKDGDFLVRESKNKKTNEPQHVLSAYWTGHKHFIIQYGEVRVNIYITIISSPYQKCHHLLISVFSYFLHFLRNH
jgi:hypothetical protein